MSTDYLLSLASLIVVSVMLAMGLNLVKGYGGIMSVSHGASMGIGAYMTGVLSTTYEWNSGLAIVAGTLVAGLLGWLFMAAAAQLEREDFILASFALQMAVIDLLLRWSDVTGGSTGLFGIPAPAEALEGALPFFILTLGVGGVSALILIYLGRSGYAIMLRGIRESHRSVEAAGKNALRIQRTSYGVSTAFAGLAGGVFATALGIITPVDFDIERSILIIAFLLVGGLGNMWGAILGAVALMIVPEVMREIDSIPTQFQGPGEQILYGVVIVLFVWFRPQGILPEKPILRLRRKAAQRDQTPRPTAAKDEVSTYATVE